MIFLLNLGFLVNFLYFFFFFFFCGVGSVVIMMLHLNCIFFFYREYRGAFHWTENSGVNFQKFLRRMEQNFLVDCSKVENVISRAFVRFEFFYDSVRGLNPKHRSKQNSDTSTR